MFGKKPPSPLLGRVRLLTQQKPIHAPAPSLEPRAERTGVFKQATLSLGDGSRVQVAIKDLSTGGARIEFFHEIALEGVFVVSEPISRLRRKAKVVWRAKGAAGLQFLD